MGLVDFASIKAEARQAVHDYLSVPATYIDPSLTEPVPINIRWHNKIDRFGDLDTGKWAEVIEGIHRIIFNRPELTELALTPRKNGKVTLTMYDITTTFNLDTMEPDTGPIEIIWMVVRK